MTDDMKKMNSYHMGKCIPQETTIKDVRLARAYVPFQKCAVFFANGSFKRGTAFPEL